MLSHLVTIRTRFVGPGSVRGSRIIATAGNKQRVTCPYQHALSVEKNHEAAARALMAKMNWPNDIIGGGFGDSDMYWVMIPQGMKAVADEGGK